LEPPQDRDDPAKFARNPCPLLLYGDTVCFRIPFSILRRGSGNGPRRRNGAAGMVPRTRCGESEALNRAKFSSLGKMSVPSRPLARSIKMAAPT
jgi:hypothetical protein